jgi:hypothetical protein
MHHRFMHLDVLCALGVTVVDLPNLPGPVFYVEECNVALINADLTPEARAAALDWVLNEAFVQDAPAS